MGCCLSRGCRKGPIHFRVAQFLCSTWDPFLRPDPPPSRRRAQERVKDGCVSTHRRLVLDGSEHDGTLAVVGMTTSRGARVWCTNIRATSLYAVGTETQTMMQ